MRILLFIVSCSLFSSVSAQVEKGRYLFGAGIMLTTFSNQTSEYQNSGLPKTVATTRTASVYLSPNAGIFVVDNLCVGLALNSELYFSKTEHSDGLYTSTYKSKSLALGPFAEYYIGKGTSGRPFISLSGGFGFGELNQHVHISSMDDIDVKTPSRNYNASLRVGYAVFLNDAFMLKLFTGFQYHNLKQTSKSDYESEVKQAETAVVVGVSLATTFKRKNK